MVATQDLPEVQRELKNGLGGRLRETGLEIQGLGGRGSKRRESSRIYPSIDGGRNLNPDIRWMPRTRVRLLRLTDLLHLTRALDG